MIFLLAIVIGTLIGYLMKGRIRNLPFFALQAAYLLLIFLLIDIFFNRFFTYFFSPYNRLLIITLLMIQYGSMFALVICNQNRWPLWLIGGGEFLNFFVILVNGGRMPVYISDPSKESRFEQLRTGQIPHYMLMDETTIFAFLGDRIPIKVFTESLLSIGDIIIWFGLVFLMLHAMKTQQKNNSSIAG